ncbi:MAG: hypothetical protein EOO39_07725 [Cytophagaceae bacterium]|nr:MAG: hypothetical protein EOO39_07725 [Cytophagaceae bacterium]
MITIMTSVLTGIALLTTTVVFGQAQSGQEKPTSDNPAVSTPKNGNSSVVVRQSGSGNRAVIHQSANGTTTETVVSHGGTNSVEVSHDGHSKVVIDQREATPQRKPQPDSTKRKN